MTASHLPSGRRLSSKIVPARTLNCAPECLALHSHLCRLGMKATSSLPQTGQRTTLSRHRREARKSTPLTGSEKYSRIPVRSLGTDSSGKIGGAAVGRAPGVKSNITFRNENNIYFPYRELIIVCYFNILSSLFTQVHNVVNSE